MTDTLIHGLYREGDDIADTDSANANIKDNIPLYIMYFLLLVNITPPICFFTTQSYHHNFSITIYQKSTKYGYLWG